MFPSPFPATVGFHIQPCHAPSDCFPEEIESVSHFRSASRRQEFFAGRTCAHRALEQLGLTPVPLLHDPETRIPAWPPETRGSLTHSGGVAAAAVAWSRDAFGIGIDLEHLPRKINPGITRHVCTPRELATWQGLPASEQDAFLKRLFSAKETIYKSLFPQLRVPIGFQDADLEFAPSTFCFTLTRSLDPGFPAGFTATGHWQQTPEFVLTSLLIPQ